jgi:type II restriction enzyme
MPGELACARKNPRQQIKLISEWWGARNLFCPNCPAEALSLPPNDTEVCDFMCVRCGERFEMKAMNSPIGGVVPDGGYCAMMRAIDEGRTPNLFLLHYERNDWRVTNLLLVPQVAFSTSAIEKCAKLPGRPYALCKILLRNIPPLAKIPVVKEGKALSAGTVRAVYNRIIELRHEPVHERCWTLDVLRIVQSLGEKPFANDKVYAFAHELEKLHPDNRHIKAKIRQQLQVLRDLGFLQHVSSGLWRLP